MKPLCIFGTLLLALCSQHSVFSQSSKELSPGYYVVVGAYASTKENVAQNYTEVLNLRGMKAKYGFNSLRNLHFVYVEYATDLRSALAKMQKTRQQPEFAEAWVRVVPGDVTAAVQQTQNDPPPAKAEVVPALSPKETVVVQPVKYVESASAAPKSTNVVYEDTEITDNPEIVQYDKITLENTEVFLSLFNARNNRIVEGSVKVIDTERSKVLKEVKGNDYLYLPNPKSKSGQITLICEAFGYKKVQQEISYPMPLADTSKSYVDLMGTTFIVYFDLIRYNKGDVATLYNVYFYNDAALMLPESKYELNSLLQMMQENPNYKIKLHGHTNGNYHGKIILMGEEKNFFSLDGSKNSMGSAKDLSEARAQIIKDYLVANGIAPERMEVKAWGGRKPIYDKHSVNAKKNVRVEVEILSQ